MKTEFWRSRGFWTAFAALLANLLALLGAVGVDLNPQQQAEILAGLNSLLALLGIVFRWQAVGPLTVGKTEEQDR
jgi:hypothetical protein